MVRTARSPIFSQAHDFSCFLADAEGTVVSQADGIPIHTGGGGFAARAIVARFGGQIAPGDVFLLNDPYAAGGNHLPDWVIARPVFVGDDHLGFACNRAHQSDIGGGAAGTYNPQATEIFHEGLRLPVMKLVEADVVREDLWELLKLNCRTPDLLDGDLRAMLGLHAHRGRPRRGAGGRARHRPGAGLFRRHSRLCRSALSRRHPRSARRHLSRRGPHRQRLLRPCRHRHPGGAHDRRRQPDWWISPARTTRSAASRNSSLANTVSGVYTALYSFFDADLPRNEGSFRGVDHHRARGAAS